MDCKIAGTEKGITGFQLDLKLRGIPHSIMADAVEKARVARLLILTEMGKTLAASRVWLGVEIAGVNAPHQTKADHADTDAFVGAQDAVP